MELKDLYKKVNEINIKKDYWFVRTDDGRYFQTYLENGFIGIGWNRISLEDLTRLSESKVKAKIAKVEGLDSELSKSKMRITAIYSKLIRFKDLRKGDVIVIPSHSSKRYAFGIVSTSRIHVDSRKSDDCDYYKRRKVNWITDRNVDGLDPNFYRMKITRHAISSVKDYEVYIDNLLDNLYLKNGYGHFILDVNKKKDINLKSLVNLVQSIQSLTESINRDFELNEDIDQSSIRLNLQSPGTIELILKKGKSLIVLAAILNIISCKDVNKLDIPQNEREEIEGFIQLHHNTIDSIENSMQELEVNKEKINSIY